MCMKHTSEGDKCYLLERMVKVETKVNCQILLVLTLVAVLTVITFKLLNSQIYLLSGEKGLHAISEESHTDFEMLRKPSECDHEDHKD